MGSCTARYKMLLFRAYTSARGWRSIELARLKTEEEEEEEEEEEKEEEFGRFGAFWFGTFVMLFRATRGLVDHKNTRRWMVRCYKRLSIYLVWDLERSFVLSYIACLRYPYINIRVYGKNGNYSKATIQTIMQRKMSVEHRVTSKGESILKLVSTKVIG